MRQEIKREDLASFGNLELMARHVVEGFITGLHKSPFHGFSVEFAEHRLYNPGESTRHIDWKLFARSDKLFTKKYEEETNLRCQMVLDVSGSMFFPVGEVWNKLRFSAYAAASLTELLRKQRDAVGLSFIREQLVNHLPAKSSGAHHRRIFLSLEELLHNYNEKDAASGNSTACLHEIAELCHRRSLIIIFTDLLDSPERQEAFFDALQHLKHNKHEVILFHVSDKKRELELQIENRPYTFVDMETGERLKLEPRNFKEQYALAMKNYMDSYKRKCLQYGIDFMEADIEEGFHHILTAYLLKRQKMR